MLFWLVCQNIFDTDCNKKSWLYTAVINGSYQPNMTLPKTLIFIFN
jgi:hypothetical protein